MTGNRVAAEDAVHPAIQRLVRRPWLPRNLEPYAFRCVRNAAVDAWRANPNPEPEPLLQTDPTGDPWLVEQVEAWLQQILPDERESIVLKIFDDLTFREIAQVKRTSINTVAAQFRRGLIKLRSLLQEEQKT